MDKELRTKRQTTVKGLRTKRQTMINKMLHRKLKIEQHESHKKMWMNSGAPEGSAVPTPLLTPVVLI